MRTALALLLALPLVASAHSLTDPVLDTAAEAQGLLHTDPVGDALLPSGDVAAGMPDGRLAVASPGLLRVYGAGGLDWEAPLPLEGATTKVVASLASIAVDVPEVFSQRWAVYDLQGQFLYTAANPGEMPVEWRIFAADETGFWVVHQTTENGPRRDSLVYRAPDGTTRWELNITPTQYVFRDQPLGQGKAGIAVYTNTSGAVDLRIMTAQGSFAAIFPFAEDDTSPEAQPVLTVDAQGDLLASVAKGDGELDVARLSAGLQFHRGHYHTLGPRITVPASVAGAPDGGIAVFATSHGLPPATLSEPVMLRFAPCPHECPLAWARTLLGLTQGAALGGAVEGSTLRFALARQCLPTEAGPSCDLAPREVRLETFEES